MTKELEINTDKLQASCLTHDTQITSPRTNYIKDQLCSSCLFRLDFLSSNQINTAQG